MLSVRVNQADLRNPDLIVDAISSCANSPSPHLLHGGWLLRAKPGRFFECGTLQRKYSTIMPRSQMFLRLAGPADSRPDGLQGFPVPVTSLFKSEVSGYVYDDETNCMHFFSYPLYLIRMRSSTSWTSRRKGPSASILRLAMAAAQVVAWAGEAVNRRAT
jgi:hypothetical protein